jgi:hypothetical protein
LDVTPTYSSRYILLSRAVSQNFNRKKKIISISEKQAEITNLCLLFAECLKVDETFKKRNKKKTRNKKNKRNIKKQRDRRIFRSCKRSDLQPNLHETKRNETKQKSFFPDPFFFAIVRHQSTNWHKLKSKIKLILIRFVSAERSISYKDN